MKKYLGIFFVLFISDQIFAADNEIFDNKKTNLAAAFDVDDLHNTTSYQLLNRMHQVLSLYSLMLAPLDGTTFAAGACFGIAYQQLKKFLPTRFSCWLPSKGLNHRETLGALLFFEEIFELKIFDHLIGDSLNNCCAELHKIIDGITLPGANAEGIIANNTSIRCDLPTCPRFVKSVCGKEFINQKIPHAIAFVFINPEPRHPDDAFFVGCGDMNQQYQQFHERIIKPLVSWNEAHKNTPIELFLHRKKMSKKTWDNAASILCASLNRKDGQVFMKDLSSLPTFIENKRFFVDGNPIYPQVDLGRALVAFDRVDPQYPEFPISTGLIYADLDIPPLAQEIIFSVANKKQIRKAGLAFIQHINLGVEETFLPGFFVMAPKINRKLFKEAYINVVMRAFDQFGVPPQYEYFAFDAYYIWNFARQNSDYERLALAWFKTLKDDLDESLRLFIALKDLPEIKPVPTLFIKNFSKLLGDNRRISFSCPYKK